MAFTSRAGASLEERSIPQSPSLIRDWFGKSKGMAMRQQHYVRRGKLMRRLQWVAMASALLASGITSAWSAEKPLPTPSAVKVKPVKSPRPHTGLLRPARIGAAPSDSKSSVPGAKSGTSNNLGGTTKAQPARPKAAVVEKSEVDIKISEVPPSSRRTIKAPTASDGLRVAAVTPVPHPASHISPPNSRSAAGTGETPSLVKAFQSAGKEPSNHTAKPLVREALEPVVNAPATPRVTPKAAPPKVSLAKPDPIRAPASIAPVTIPEPVTAEYSEEAQTVSDDAGATAGNEQLAPIVSSAGLRRPQGLGMRRSPDGSIKAPTPPPEASVPAPYKSTGVLKSPPLKLASDSTPNPAKSLLAAREKFRGATVARRGEVAMQSNSAAPSHYHVLPESTDDDNSQASLAHLQLPESQFSAADEATESADHSIFAREAITQSTPTRLTTDGQPATNTAASATAASSTGTSTTESGRILFFPPTPTPPTPTPPEHNAANKPRLLDAPTEAYVLIPAVPASTSKSANALRPQNAKSAEAELLVKPAFVIKPSASK